MDLKKLGEMIAKARKEKKLTQEELADKLKIHVRTISRWERGIHAPDVAILVPLCQELGLTVNELLESGDETSNTKTIDAIQYYSSRSKKKYAKSFFCILVFLIAFFTLSMFMMKRNEFRLYQINMVTGNYHIKGHVGFNPTSKLFAIEKIRYVDEYVNTDREEKTKRIDINFLCNEHIFYSYFYENDMFTSVNGILENFQVFGDERNMKEMQQCSNLKNVIMNVKYRNQDNELKYSSIKLNIQEIT